MDKVCVIIPVKDEEVGLQYLADYRASKQLNYDVDFIFVLIVGPVTTQNSSQKTNGRLIDQKESHGKGAAVRQAVYENNTTDYVVFLDADGHS